MNIIALVILLVLGLISGHPHHATRREDLSDPRLLSPVKEEYFKYSAEPIDFQGIAARLEQMLSEAQSDDLLTEAHEGKHHRHRRHRRHTLARNGSKDGSSSQGTFSNILGRFQSAYKASIISDQAGSNFKDHKKGIKPYSLSLFSSAVYKGRFTLRPGLKIVNYLRMMTYTYPLVREYLKNFHFVKATGNYMAVADPVNKHLIIAYRGTNPLWIPDLFNDMLILMNLSPWRWIPAYLWTKRIMLDHPGYTVTLTGHSLGGTIAERVGQHFNGQVKVVSFNPGQCPFADQLTTFPFIIAYKIKGDIISKCKSKAGTIEEFDPINTSMSARHAIKEVEELYKAQKLPDSKII